jgi:hypothetical protein
VALDEAPNAGRVEELNSGQVEPESGQIRGERPANRLLQLHTGGEIDLALTADHNHARGCLLNLDSK